jgi:hypothetical protein
MIIAHLTRILTYYIWYRQGKEKHNLHKQSMMFSFFTMSFKRQIKRQIFRSFSWYKGHCQLVYQKYNICDKEKIKINVKTL